MKRLVLSSLLVCMFGSVALAGSLDPIAAPESVVPPAPAALDWSGFYLGLSAGAGFAGDVNYYTGGVLSDGPWPVEGTQFGGFAGYNQQFGALVVGGELAYSAGNVAMTAFPTYRYTDFIDAKLRVGYGAERFMPYAFAGYTSGTWDDPSFGAPVSASGLIYGAGVDFKLTDRLFVGADYTMRDLTSDRNPGMVVENVSKASVSSFGLRIGLSF